MPSDHAAVSAFISAHYGLPIAQIVDGPRGWVGETFILTASDGVRHFVKLFSPENFIRAPDSSLLVLEQLREVGIGNLIYPIRTVDGAVSAMFGEKRAVVYEFIEGAVGKAVGFDFPQYADIMARVHRAQVPAMRDLPLEDFSLPFSEPLVVALDQFWSSAGVTAPQRDSRRFLGQYRSEIEAGWDELQALAVAVRDARWTPVITHSDALDHNLLVDANGKVYITDWDEMMLGPQERDTWFWLYGDESPEFLRVYRQQFPGYQPDATLCRFYLLRRFYEDLVGYVEEIDRRSLEGQVRLFNDMSTSWFAWLWPPMHMPGPYHE